MEPRPDTMSQAADRVAGQRNLPPLRVLSLWPRMRRRKGHPGSGSRAVRPAQDAGLGSLADGSQSESMGDLSGADQHMADAGTETFEREKDMSILSGVEAELADVE